MPVLSKFCGVVVGMWFVPLLGAHFHAIYGEHEVMVSIPSLSVIQGELPEPVSRMVLDWAWRHQADLMLAWHRCAERHCPESIPPVG